MQQDTTGQLEFTAVDGKRILAVFDEPCVTSDFGSLLLSEVERHVGVVKALSEACGDSRRQSHVKHSSFDVCLQRVLQICCGYYDANDCDHLRDDPALKVSVGRDPIDGDALCSQPTMSRLENSVTTRDLLRMGYGLIDNFTSSYDEPPKAIVLDMDPTADRAYGQQQLTFFNAFVGGYCFMPYHIYEGSSGKLITTVFRTGKSPSGKEIISILKRVVRRIRQAWPETEIVFRADGHHASGEVLNWLDEHRLIYVIALPQNKALNRRMEFFREGLQKAWERTGRPCRRFHSFQYGAGTWDRQRRVIARGMRSANGMDVRYIVTNLPKAGSRYLYETVYCGRGNAELMIKEHKCFLGSDRTSCHRKEANQFRLFLHSAAYVLMHALREKLLKATELARAQFDTIRLRLLKIGATVEVKKTLVRFHLPAAYPLKGILAHAADLLATGFQT
jgi:hypothetical protein